ncbi:MAG TPA: hypothetical protein VMK65_11530 [Longimicrobiales bacterium]|nr:hypothetical protein [Longimicrobiales bacterium]
MTTPMRRCLPLLAALVAAGCGDAPTEPAALLVARETRAALQVSESLPTLPALMARAREAAVPGLPASEPVGAGAEHPAGTSPGPEGDALERAFGLWLDAQADPAADADGRVAEAYAAAAPVLASRLGAAGLEAALEDARRWVGLARPLVSAWERPGLRAALREGEALLDASVGLAADGDTVAAVRTLLHAADRLRETTPWAVSGVLVAEVEGELARRGVGPIDPSPPPADSVAVRLARLQRLLHGAREAREEGDYPLAIQRAWYARQLLDGMP